jgi:2-dehydro-3-deoxygalactonokinase
LYATLKQHSILGRLMPAAAGNAAGDAGDAGDADAAHDAIAAAAYRQALALARDSAPGDLMRHLFTARSMNLAGRLPAAVLGDYLSGLLIGHELVSATAWLARRAGAGIPIVLIGEDALLGRYQAALATFGLQATRRGNTAAAGLHHLLTLIPRRRVASAARPDVVSKTPSAPSADHRAS